MRCHLSLLALTLLIAPACRDKGPGGSVTPPPSNTDGGIPMGLECPGEGTTVCALKLASSSRHPAVDEPVTLTNVVVTTATVVISRFDGMVTLAGFYVQDPDGAAFLDGRYSGIAVVYNPAQVVGRVPPIGTKITVEGTYAEFGQMGFDLQKQVRAARIETNNELGTVTPYVISAPNLIAKGGADAAAYEGALVTVESVTVKETTVTTPNGQIFGAFRLDGDLVISGVFYQFQNPVLGEIMTRVSGVLRVGTAPFDAGEYLLSPRSSGEVVPQNPRTVVSTIAGIQDPASPDRPTEICAQPDNGKPCPKVELRRVLVTATGGYINTNLRALWVTDPNDADGKYASVAAVYDMRQVASPPQVGWYVDIDGTLQDFFGSRQINRPTFTRNGTDTGVVMPRVVVPETIGRLAPSAREYEGSLVRIENVTVTNRCLESDSGRDFGGWVVTGDVQIGTAYFYDYNGRPIPSGVMCQDQNGDPTGDCACEARARPMDMRNDGDMFASITGIVYYSFNTFQLVPRGNDDLVRR